MWVFYLLSSLIVIANLYWLWRQAQSHTRPFYVLGAILGIAVLGGILTTFWPEFWLIGGIQLVALGVLLWGNKVDERWIAAVLVLGLLLLLFFPFPMVELLTWGLITAVPFTTFYFLRSRSTIPIITPAISMLQNRPVRVKGRLTPEVIESQLPLLECLTDGIIYNGQEGVVVYVNQAAATIMGLQTEQMIGMPAAKILARLPIFAPNTPLAAPNRFELNGRIIQGHLNIVYNTNGVAQGTVAVLRDITAEYQAQRTRDGFLTTISHELRTPITAIKGYVELMDSGAGGELTAYQKTFLKTIQRNVNRLIHLINSLIFASAIKGGRLEFTPGYADLPQLIQQIVREMRPKAAENDLTIQVNMENGIGRVHIDPTHLATILEELVSNAMKYNRPGGEIQISASLTSDEKNSQTFAVVSVGDTGIGIEPADQAHIFEDFFRPDQLEEQVRGGGIGMGLSIVRALVEAYNGRIWFDTTPGRGTTFTFIIPTEQQVGK